MKILDGKKLSEEILKNLKEKIKKKKLSLKLAVIQVGGDKASAVFVSQKKKACQKVGIRFELFEFSKKVKKEKLEKKIKELAKSCHGLVIQLPLPKGFDQEKLLNLIPREKDPDLLSDESFMGSFRKSSDILPPVTGAIDLIFKKYKIGIKGKNAAIIGKSRLIGLPSLLWALREGATVSVINSLTKDPAFFTKKADIVISGTGKPGLIKRKAVKRGAVVIDCGTTKVKGKLKGDADFKSLSKKASFITPVPGGIGPLTVALLLKNLVELNEKK